MRRFSYRQVALLGSLINFMGGLATVYSPNLHLLILSYGVVQGVGYGLLLPASFSALNAYFDKKMALMMSINQTLLVAGYMVMPYLSNWCLNFYGYQGTLLLLAGVAAFCFPASLALQPVKWHMKFVEETSELWLMFWRYCFDWEQWISCPAGRVKPGGVGAPPLWDREQSRWCRWSITESTLVSGKFQYHHQETGLM